MTIGPHTPYHSVAGKVIVKICGVTSVKDARLAARAGADLIGLNFYSRSPRHVTVTQATEIVQHLPRNVEAVGVFVNASSEEIREVTRAVGLKTVQLHGDEPPELFVELDRFRLIRAYCWTNGGPGPLEQHLQQAKQAGRQPDVILVDAAGAGQYGGSGQTLPWEDLAEQYARHRWPPLLLAGGLRPDNVATAIEKVRPWGVDVASGVEQSPGLKDAEKVIAFVQAARQTEQIPGLSERI